MVGVGLVAELVGVAVDVLPTVEALLGVVVEGNFLPESVIRVPSGFSFALTWSSFFANAASTAADLALGTGAIRRSFGLASFDSKPFM